MAKTKISELEKMYGTDRKEIIAFLNEKGIEAKTASSSVDEEAAAMVEKKFGKKAAETEAAKKPATEKTEKTDKVEKAEKLEKTEKTEKAAAAKPATEKSAAPKKKKIIIVTNGNQGHGTSNGRTGAYSTGNAGNNGNGGSGAGASRGARPQQQRPAKRENNRDNNRNNGGRMAAQTMYHPIKPLTAPSQMDLDYHKPIPKSTQPKPKVEPKVEVKAAEKLQETAAQSAAQNVQQEAAKDLQQNAAQTVSSNTAAAPAPAVSTQQAAQAQPAASAQEDAVKTQAPQSETSGRTGAGEERNTTARDQRDNRAPEQRRYTGDGQRNNDGQRSQGGYNNNRGGQGGYGQNRQGQGGYNNNRGGQGGYGQNRQGQGGYNNNRGGQGGYGQSRPGQGGQGGYNNNRGGQGGYGQSRPGQSGQGGYNNNRGGQGGYGQGRPGQGGTRPGFGGDRNRRNAGPGRPAQTGNEPFVKDAEKHRDENRRKQNQERDKRSKKDLIYTDDEKSRKNRPGRFIKPEKKEEEPAEEKIKVIALPEKLTIRELAEKMHMQPAEIIKKLFLQGQVMTVNSELTFEEAENIAIEYEIMCEKEEKVDVIEELLKEEEEQEENLESRPPVICVMGHVDHGKTSLLDAIRKTNVTDKEAGGITQHIGAYTVKANDRPITFLDTPGHEAFTAMRMRGANSTDIAVLVVAADDGVMPQTVEAINHAKAAGIEIIVAVNKIDKPNANIDRVKQELTEYELVATDWGGSTEFVPVSAKTGEGIEDLLETILLTADILELKANPNRRARGLVLEAKLDKGRGPVANILVQKGTLHVGDFISAGESSGKVRAMVDDKGRRVKEVGPSMPAEILGLSSVPSAGEVILAHDDDKTAKSYAATYKTQHKETLIEETRMRMSLDDLFTQMKEGNLKEFDIIIKADVQGSVEALKQSLLKLSNDEVVVKVIHGGVGAINESDVTLASASNAIIIGFNVRPDATAKAMAEHEGVDVRLYKVIYQAIDDVEAALKGMRAPVYEEKVIGHAEVRQIFKASQVGNIAGSFVLDGVFKKNCQIRIRRGDEQIYEGSLASLKRFKDDVKEVKEGYECGLVFEGFDKMQELDIVEAYEMVEVPRT